MRNILRTLGIIAIIAIIGFSFTACGNKISGTFVNVDREEDTITFRGSNFTWEDTGWGWSETGTFTVSGDVVTLTSDGESLDLTIVDSKTLTLQGWGTLTYKKR